MSADLRGFTYPLEALQCRQQWQFDAAQAALGRAQRAVDIAQETLAALLDAHTVAIHACSLQGSLHGSLHGSVRSTLNSLLRIDPVQQRQNLAYLVDSNQRVAQQRDLLEQAEKVRQAARLACQVQQMKVELGERHRQSCLAVFRDCVQIRESNDADREWLARSRWRMSASLTMDAGDSTL